MIARSVSLTCLVFVFFILLACTNKNELLQGYVEGDYIQLASNEQGILTHLYVVRGDHVKKSQLIFTLEKEPQASTLRSAQERLAQAQQVLTDLERGQRNTVIDAITARINQAQATMKLSKNNYERINALYKAQAIDRAAADQAQFTYERDIKRVSELQADLQEAKQGARENQIKAQTSLVNALRADVAQARWHLEQKNIFAPQDGFIFDTFFKQGEYVPSQKSVVSLLTPENIYLVFYIPEKQRGYVGIGRQVKFTCDGCRKDYFGKIYFISPQAEYTPPVIFSRESRNKLVYRIEAELKVDDAKQLYPGQPVDVYLLKDRARS